MPARTYLFSLSSSLSLFVLSLEKETSLNAKFGIVIMDSLDKGEMSLYRHSHHPIGVVFVGCGYIKGGLKVEQCC